MLSAAASLSTGDGVSELVAELVMSEVDEDMVDESASEVSSCSSSDEGVGGSSFGSGVEESSSASGWVDESATGAEGSATTAVEVATAALMMVNVSVVVGPSLAATARTEGERMRARVARVIAKRILAR